MKINQQLNNFLNYYLKYKTLNKKDKEIIYLTHLLTWVAHEYFFFDGTDSKIKSCQYCLDYYEYYINKFMGTNSWSVKNE